MPFHVFSMALSLLLIGRVEGTPLLEERISSLESTVAAQIASISSLDETVAGLNAKLGALEEWARGHSEFTSSDGAWRTPRAKTGRSLHSPSWGVTRVGSSSVSTRTVNASCSMYAKDIYVSGNIFYRDYFLPPPLTVQPTFSPTNAPLPAPTGAPSPAPSASPTINSFVSCLDAYQQGERVSQLYPVRTTIGATTALSNVYCDMATDGGGWALVAKYTAGTWSGDPRGSLPVGSSFCAGASSFAACGSQMDSPGLVDGSHRVSFDLWNQLARSGRGEMRRSSSNSYFKRATSPATFDYARAFYQWDYNLGTRGSDFKLFTSNGALEANGADSGTCNYANFAKDNHYVSSFRDCSDHTWHIGTWGVDCIGDELGTSTCAASSLHRYSTTVWAR